jgi:hypothetical protein
MALAPLFELSSLTYSSGSAVKPTEARLGKPARVLVKSENISRKSAKEKNESDLAFSAPWRENNPKRPQLRATTARKFAYAAKTFNRSNAKNSKQTFSANSASFGVKNS